MPLYTSTGAFNVAVNDTTGTGRYSASGALRINLVTGASYVGLYAADGALNVVDVSGVAVSTYGGLYHPSGAIRGRTAPTTLSGLQAPDGSYYFLGLFSPLNLFANGEQGAWYDPSDFSTMYQDAAGTTPVTAVEQPVGLLLDKSRGLVLGAELVTNGDFSSNTWWSTGGGAAISGGALNFTAAVATSGAYRLGFATVGKYYELTFEIISISSGGIQITLGTSSGTNRTAAGVYTQRILCTGNGNLTLYSVGASTTASVDNVSIKEVQGNHASQSTAASRPVLSARVNLLTYSEQFNNAAWLKENLLTVLPNTAIAPDGTMTAETLTSAVATAATRVNQVVYPLPSGTATASYYVRANGARFLQASWTTSASSQFANFDLQTELVTGGTYTSATITPSTNGYYRITLTSNLTSVSGSPFLAMVDSGSAPRGSSFTGDGTSGIYIWGADLRVTNVGVNLPAYQRVAAATDYDTSGFPLYLKFDGVDDSLSTGTIDFTATDKMSVFAGLRKLGTAANEFIAETSVDYSANAGAFTLTARGSNTDYLAFKGGTSGTFNDCYFETDAVPATFVFTGTIDINQALIANESDVRLNGATTSQTHAGTVQTGNFGNYPLYIGRRGGTTFPYNGLLYSLIIRGALSTDAQIASTETYVNSKTGAY